MDSAKREDAADLQSWWSSAPQLDEHALRDGVISLLRKIHEASVFDDWSTMEEYIKLYQLGESYCTEEPHLSLYEFGQMGICTYVADNLMTRGEFAAAVKKLQEIDELFAQRVERYAKLEKPARMPYRIRGAQLLDAAEIKWIGKEEWRDVYLSPKQLVEELLTLAPEYTEFYQHAVSPDENANAREALALTEIAVCKVACRYAQNLLPDCVDGFNQRYGRQLMLPEKHYKSVDAAQGDHSAYYWDFELAKLRFSDSAELNDIYILIEMRALAAQHTFGEWPIQGLLRNWRREALLIINEVKHRSAAVS